MTQPAMAALRPFPDPDLLANWADPQTQMGKIVRWSSFQDKPQYPIRSQNNLAHTYGIMTLARQLCGHIRSTETESPSWDGFDGALLLAAVSHHDQGEGCLGKDWPKFLKTDEKDLQEYEAMKLSWSTLSPAVQRFEENSFLLQFCIKCPECFPADARSAMEHLRRWFPYEARAFACLEHFDYLLYALEQYQMLGNEMIMVQVTRDQLATLDNLTADFPVFKEIFWTAEIRGWFVEMLDFYQGRFTGPQGTPD